jgi:hypothetical protein
VCSHYLHTPYATSLGDLSASDAEMRREATDRGALVSQSRGWGSLFLHPSLHHRDPPQTNYVLFVLPS